MVTTEKDEIVNVPVPRKYLDVVYRALANAMSSGLELDAENGSQSSVGAGSQSADEMRWQKADIDRLKKLIRTPTPRVMLDLTTERPNELVPLQEIREHAGRTHAQARADLAGFTQQVRRQFGRDNWPVRVDWSDGGHASYYCDDQDIARWWRSEDS